MLFLKKKIDMNICYESKAVCSTLTSAIKPCLNTLDFDTVIIDEATQATVLNSLIPLSHNVKRLILVGDQNQLEVFVESKFDYLRNTDYFKSFYNMALNKGAKYCFLDIQFRMHPQISEFPNRRFYDRMIGDAEELDGKRKIKAQNIDSDSHMIFYDVPDGVEEKVHHSYQNVKECEFVINILKSFSLLSNIDPNDIGVITPYRAQKLIIKEKLKDSGIKDYRRIKVSSVDAFQGSEKEYIIISVSKTQDFYNSKSFLKDFRRLNVALTRAKTCLIIVGNLKGFLTCNYWNDLYYFGKSKGYFKEFKNIIIKPKPLPAIIDIYDDSVDQRNIKSGLQLKEVESTISKSNVRVLWPDKSEDI